MRILFGIMSAVQPAQTVAALCDAIGAAHPILIHHDFSQQPDFRLDRANIRFVEDPVRTGWGNWGFTEGIQKLVRSAMARDDWDFLQLLSPTCMPIRPISDFDAHLEASGADYLIDGVNIDTSDHILMSHGWRAFAQEGLLRHRVLRRARRWYLGDDSLVSNYAGLSFPVRSRLTEGGIAALKARIGLRIMQTARAGHGFRHVFSSTFPCHTGSNWFGASRKGCAYLLSKTEGTPLLEYFKGIHMPDEMLYPSIFMNSELKGGVGVHHISTFVGARPAWITTADLDEALNSGKFFARKFPEDTSSDVRLELAKRLSLRSNRRHPPPAEEDEGSAMTPSLVDSATRVPSL
jgi:hypothetical protein